MFKFAALLVALCAHEAAANFGALHSVHANEPLGPGYTHDAGAVLGLPVGARQPYIEGGFGGLGLNAFNSPRYGLGFGFGGYGHFGPYSGHRFGGFGHGPFGGHGYGLGPRGINNLRSLYGGPFGLAYNGFGPYGDHYGGFYGGGFYHGGLHSGHGGFGWGRPLNVAPYIPHLGGPWASGHNWQRAGLLPDHLYGHSWRINNLGPLLPNGPFFAPY